MLYLAVVVIFHTGLFVVQMVEEVAGEQEGFCKALGFFLEWIGWVQLATAFLVVAYQLYLLWKTVRQPYEVAAPATNPKKWHFLVLLTVWTPSPAVCLDPSLGRLHPAPHQLLVLGGHHRRGLHHGGARGGNSHVGRPSLTSRRGGWDFSLPAYPGLRLLGL